MRWPSRNQSRTPSVITMTTGLALLSIFVQGCYQVQVTELLAYDAARKVAPKGAAHFLRANEVDWESMPSLVKYANISAISGNPGFLEGAIRRRAKDLEPDLVVFAAGPAIYTGSVAVYGNGIALSSPMYAQVLHGTCYRLTPGRFGCKTDGEGTICSIDADSKVREAGIHEGDRVLSINGRYFDSALGAISWRPGDKVRVIGIRPYTGKMEAEVTIVENPVRGQLALPPEQAKSQRATGSSR